MAKNTSPEAAPSLASASPRPPFSPGAMVLVTLGNPRDKFWGMLLSLAPAGLSLSGAELASFEDLILLVRDGDGQSFTPAVVFFPMHRIERIELDLPDGPLPSLSQRFSRQTGRTPQTALRAPASLPSTLPSASIPAPRRRKKNPRKKVTA